MHGVTTEITLSVSDSCRFLILSDEKNSRSFFQSNFKIFQLLSVTVYVSGTELAACITDTSNWTYASRLHFNPSKTDINVNIKCIWSATVTKNN